MKFKPLKIYECLCSEEFAGIFCEHKKQSDHLLYLIENNIFGYKVDTNPKQIAVDSRITLASQPPIFQSCSTVLNGLAFVFGGSRAPRQVTYSVVK